MHWSLTCGSCSKGIKKIVLQHRHNAVTVFSLHNDVRFSEHKVSSKRITRHPTIPFNALNDEASRINFQLYYNHVIQKLVVASMKHMVSLNIPCELFTW